MFLQLQFPRKVQGALFVLKNDSPEFEHSEKLKEVILCHDEIPAFPYHFSLTFGAHQLRRWDKVLLGQIQLISLPIGQVGENYLKNLWQNENVLPLGGDMIGHLDTKVQIDGNTRFDCCINLVRFARRQFDTREQARRIGVRYRLMSLLPLIDETGRIRGVVGGE